MKQLSASPQLQQQNLAPSQQQQTSSQRQQQQNDFQENSAQVVVISESMMSRCYSNPTKVDDSSNPTMGMESCPVSKMPPISIDPSSVSNVVQPPQLDRPSEVKPSV
jgi:hypothetical protein